MTAPKLVPQAVLASKSCLSQEPSCCFDTGASDILRPQRPALIAPTVAAMEVDESDSKTAAGWCFVSSNGSDWGNGSCSSGNGSGEYQMRGACVWAARRPGIPATGPLIEGFLLLLLCAGAGLLDSTDNIHAPAAFVKCVELPAKCCWQAACAPEYLCGRAGLPFGSTIKLVMQSKRQLHTHTCATRAGHTILRPAGGAAARLLVVYVMKR